MRASLSNGRGRAVAARQPKVEAVVALTTSQSSELSNRLDTLGKEVRHHIRETIPQIADQRAADLADTAYDAGDEAVASMLEEFSHTLLERYVRELRQIDTARRRLTEGEIDECVDCGGDIGYKRLHVHPVATRCIHCQTRYEKMYAGETSPRL